MGFPVGYTELMLPKFLLHVVFLLGYLRRVVTWTFDLFGLAHLLLDSSDVPPSSTGPLPPPVATTYDSSSYRPRLPANATKPLFALLVQAALPVSVYGSSTPDEADNVCCSCAVCLHEFSAGEEVRRLSNCRHVFHRCCLDPWVELDQRTCPLCRTPLVPEQVRDDIDRKLRADGGSLSDNDSGAGPQSSSASDAASSYFYYDNYSESGDFYDESFGFVLPSAQAQAFPWPSTAVTL